MALYYFFFNISNYGQFFFSGNSEFHWKRKKKKKKEQALQPLATLPAIVEASRSKATEQYWAINQTQLHNTSSHTILHRRAANTKLTN